MSETKSYTRPATKAGWIIDFIILLLEIGFIWLAIEVADTWVAGVIVATAMLFGYVQKDFVNAKRRREL